MPNTYTWVVDPNGLVVNTVDGREDTVVSVRFSITASDGVITAENTNMVQVPLNPGENFTPFSELTQAQVLDWVKAALGPQKVSMLESMLDKKLEILRNPPTRPAPKAAPWATCTPRT